MEFVHGVECDGVLHQRCAKHGYYLLAHHCVAVLHGADRAAPLDHHRVVLAVLALGSIMASLYELYAVLLSDRTEITFDTARWIRDMINYSIAFLIWSAMYFLINTLENFRKAEIENLRWEALRNETELNRLKSQLNPHFMFNAMNVIRALVDENPARSKDAITQLSGLLRNTLQFGKHKTVSLGKELEVVRDYLALESARMEERLRVEWNVREECESFEVPPLMLQTLVENCIKHGIARIPEGGVVRINASCSETGLKIVLENSGTYDPARKTESGFGLRNSIERLNLLYGNEATLNIRNSSANTVITEVFIPKTRNV
jgi:two-component system, LytTR family, sensor kinase